MECIEERISFYDKKLYEADITENQRAALLLLVERLSGEWVSQSIRLEVVGEIQGILGEKERQRRHLPLNSKLSIDH